MRNVVLGALAALGLGAGLAVAQAPSSPAPKTSDPVVASAPAGAVEPRTDPPLAGPPPAAALPGQTAGPVASFLLNGGGSQSGSCCAGGAPAGAAPWACDHGCTGGPDIWASAEYLLWWIKDGPLGAPLVTTGPPGSRGILGQPGTGVLFGGSDLDYHAFSGARFTLGLWLDDHECLGLEGSGFFLENKANLFVARSTVTGGGVLARPFVDALTGAETSELVAAPGQALGDIRVRSTSNLYGWELNALGNLARENGLCLDVLAGFRYLEFKEGIGIDQTSTLLPGGTATFEGMLVMPPGTVDVVDSFRTRSQFYGGQVGTRAEYSWGPAFLQVLGKVAVGDSHEVGSIAGLSTLTGTAEGARMVLPGGLLAVSSNSGRLVHDEFSVVPELGINVGCQIGCHLRAFVGYSFLYWSDVARSGDLINRTVNPTLVPTNPLFGLPLGPNQPVSTLRSTDFWAQGVNFGLELRY